MMLFTCNIQLSPEHKKSLCSQAWYSVEKIKKKSFYVALVKNYFHLFQVGIFLASIPDTLLLSNLF